SPPLSPAGERRHEPVPSPSPVTWPAPEPLIDSGSPSGSVNEPCVVSVSLCPPFASAACSSTTGGASAAVHVNESVTDPPNPSDAVIVTGPLPSTDGV